MENNRSPKKNIFQVATSSGMNIYENKVEKDTERMFEDIDESNKYEMFPEEIESSSFTMSPSLESADEEEDMDNEDQQAASRPSQRGELDSEIAFRYRMEVHRIEDVLKKDLEALQSMQQPDLVFKQLQMLREELNGAETLPEEDFCLSNSCFLWVIPEDDVNEVLEHQEDCLLQLMYED